MGNSKDPHQYIYIHCHIFTYDQVLHMYEVFIIYLRYGPFFLHPKQKMRRLKPGPLASASSSQGTLAHTGPDGC